MKSIKYKKIKDCKENLPEISIVIRCKNESKYIDSCIGMLELQDIDMKKEIIIIDSGSTDNTVNLALKYDVSVYLIDSKDFNFGTSINLGVTLSRGKFCVFLSAHAIPKNKNWLYELVTPLLKDKKIVASYSRQIYYEDSFIMEKRSLNDTFGNMTRLQKIDECSDISFMKVRKEVTFSNASSCIRKDVALKYPFKELPASEDREWAFRILKDGYKIFYNPKSEIYHAHNENIKQWYHRIYINSKALYQFAGVKINIFHTLPIFFMQIYKDLKFCHREHIKVKLDLLKIFFKYEFYYVLAHYKSTREK